MFNALQSLYQSNVPRAVAITIAMAIVFAFLLWVSIIDLKRRSVTFWKMLLASGSVILVPFIVSLFYTCEKLGTLKWYIISAIPLWFLILYLNIKLNKDKFMGKADIDLLSAIFSVGLTYSVWLSTVVDKSAIVIRITGFWYSVLGYLVIGAGIYLIVFIFLVVTKVATRRKTIKELIKDTRISIIPMFMPVSVMVPYIILAS